MLKALVDKQKNMSTTIEDVKAEQEAIIGGAIRRKDWKALEGFAQSYAAVDNMEYATYLRGLSVKFKNEPQATFKMVTDLLENEVKKIHGHEKNK